LQAILGRSEPAALKRGRVQEKNWMKMNQNEKDQPWMGKSDHVKEMLIRMIL